MKKQKTKKKLSKTPTIDLDSTAKYLSDSNKEDAAGLDLEPLDLAPQAPLATATEAHRD